MATVVTGCCTVGRGRFAVGAAVVALTSGAPAGAAVGGGSPTAVVLVVLAVLPLKLVVLVVLATLSSTIGSTVGAGPSKVPATSTTAPKVTNAAMTPAEIVATSRRRGVFTG